MPLGCILVLVACATEHAVHENDDYKALQEQHQETYKSLVGDEIYNKYELVQ